MRSGFEQVRNMSDTLTVSRKGLAPAERATIPSAAGLPESLSQEDRDLLEALESAVAMLGEEEGGADHPLVEARDRILDAYRDKAALLKRDWTDEMFQEGEEDNEERVAELEAMLAAGLSSTGAGLERGTNLGAALDLVGVYMKNYKLDKADAVLARCGPFVSSRGGVWMIKWLNHVSTVRMKQSRHMEALEMLYDLELYSPYDAKEAPEFFETLYRNLAWALKSLGRIDDALVYFERMAQASSTHKGGLDWFDFWDIGKLAAARAYRDTNMPAFYRGRAMVEDSLRMHIEAEPEDLVMRAKVHDSLAECYFVVKDYADAERHYDSAYELLLQTVGSNSPLFGKQARHSANLYIEQGDYAKALPFLREALNVEASKDSVRIMDLMEVVDLLVNAQQRVADLPSEGGLEGLQSNDTVLKRLQQNVHARSLGMSKEYGVLCHKMSLLYLHESKHNDKAFRRARRLAKESVKLLRQHSSGDSDANSWLQMGELHLQMLSSAAPPRTASAADRGKRRGSRSISDGA